ncbi:MAG TPA: hypothetical protein VMR45_03445, partial [Patescibacteria group bacterium]|nr:hypothetical protein [Patescibacteria group bacterium]
WQNSGISVPTGGTLYVKGTAASPVIFTSINDDSIGGDSGGDGATSGSRGEYPVAVTIADGVTASVSHAVFNYASRAFIMSGGTATISDTRIERVSYGLMAHGKAHAQLSGMTINDVTTAIEAIESSTVGFRGKITNTSDKAIKACDWIGGCSVEASHVDWGSAKGPFTDSGTLVCGQVIVSPWQNGGLSYGNIDIFSVPNCGSLDTPEQNMTATILGYQSSVQRVSIDCSNGMEDACKAISTSQVCLSSALALAKANAPFPLPDASTSEKINGYAGELGGFASDFIESVEGSNSMSNVVSAQLGIVQVLGVYSSLSSAFGSCHPSY